MNKDSILPPEKEFKLTRRNLPHWEYPGSTYFITFNVAVEYELNDAAKDIIYNSINFHANKKYELFAFVVMSTHMHIILSPSVKVKDLFFGLAEIVHSIKSYSANKIQKTLGKTGNIWLSEKYDRIIRSDSELFEEMSYIINNPVKAGLVHNPEDYKWLYYKVNL